MVNTYQYINKFLAKYGKEQGTGGPGIIRIKLPPGAGNKVIYGILASDINISVNTTYGSVLPDTSTFSDIGFMMGAENITTWVGASALAWKGTDPVRFGAEMYLVNYAPGLGYEDDLKALTKMCTLGIPRTGGDIRDDFQVRVHGGYAGDPFASNKDYHAGNNPAAGKGIWGSIRDRWDVPDKDGKAPDVGARLDIIKSEVAKSKSVIGTDIKGTIEVKIGSNFTLQNLLLTRVDVTPSLVEVKGEGDYSPKPLYYRVQMSFTTCRAALEEDVQGMFGG